MKKHIVGLLLFTFTVSASLADTFNINGREITVPAPEGFVRITPEMTAVTKIVEQLSTPTNEVLAYYIEEDQVLVALAGEVPDLEHTCVLLIVRELKEVTLRDRDFSQLKNTIKTQNKEVFDAARARIAGEMEGIGGGISDAFDVDFAINVSQVVPLEPHYESRNALAFSMHMDVGVSAGSDQSQMPVATTLTLVNVSGTVLSLSANGVPETLESTRDASLRWTEAVLAGNDVSSEPVSASGRIGQMTGRVLVWVVIAWFATFLVKRFRGKKTA